MTVALLLLVFLLAVVVPVVVLFVGTFVQLAWRDREFWIDLWRTRRDMRRD